METSKQIVLETLEFRRTHGRAARDLWLLPWVNDHYPQEVKEIQEKYPTDFGGLPLVLKEKGIEQGDPYAVGESTDAWGCQFVNIMPGIIGEVKRPLVEEEDWEDVDKVHIPTEWLSFDVEQVNRDLKKYCADKFVLAGCPRPFEQLQFIRGTENFYCDLMTRPKNMLIFLGRMHEFYCEYLEKLAQTDCDGLYFMDDWGSQKALLINPETWKEIFRPMYRDFIDIARKHGKKTFMHSDGFTLDIIPELIDLGLDAINSQIFCTGIENLKPYRGKITFWGEIDRQHLLPYGSVQDIEKAVEKVYDSLWQDGGCIAQCEFGPGAKPENVEAVYRTWEKLTR